MGLKKQAKVLTTDFLIPRYFQMALFCRRITPACRSIDPLSQDDRTGVG